MNSLLYKSVPLIIPTYGQSNIFAYANLSMIQKDKNITSGGFKGDFLIVFITLKKFRLLRHLLVNLTLITIGFAIRDPGKYEGLYDLFDSILGLVILTALFYTNLYILTPRILFKGRLVKYLLVLSLLVSLEGLISYSIHDFFIDRHGLAPLKEEVSPLKSMVAAIIVFLPLIAFSTSIKFFQKWYFDSETMHDLAVKAKDSELQALRSQIQPHFLFNMLNSIKVLIRREPEKAEQITIKLSDFLRHLLYENKVNKVFLSSEIRFLTDYLILEKMRRDEFEFSFKYDEVEVKGIQIPPNLLLILVENAVKHSLDPQDISYIDVRISAIENELCFFITNSIPQIRTIPRSEGGIGLANIRRRLELLYGNRYDLNSSVQPDKYIATLKLPL